MNNFRSSYWKSRVDQEVREDWEELEARGFVFMNHFGILTVRRVRQEMDEAFRQGRLYEWLRRVLGVEVT